MNFAAALEADRLELNQRFKIYNTQGSPLDAVAFKEHLLTRVEPIVSAVSAEFPERVRLVTRELYEVSLQLFRAGYWSGKAQSIELSKLWQEVLPALKQLVVREPERVSGALSNALINLCTGSMRADQWLNDVREVGSECDNVAELLDVAGVLAWRAGMALLRRHSLEILGKLPNSLACRTLGVVASTRQPELIEILKRLQDDPWYNPTEQFQSNLSAKAIREVARVGNYSGLGGGLMDLPKVFELDGALYLTDQQNTWRIEADVFGCILQAVPTAKPNSKKNRTGPLTIDTRGRVVGGESEQTFAYLADSTSQACDAQTLAVTLPNSFHVYLLAASGVTPHA